MAIKKKVFIPALSLFLAIALLTVGVVGIEKSVTSNLLNRTAPNGEKYDLSVTTFNVGGFAAGVDSGITKDATGYGWSDALKYWDNDIPTFTADIFGMQEFVPMYYKEKTDNKIDESTIIWSKDKFADIFPQLEVYEGLTYDTTNMYNALATTENGYKITDVSGGHLSGKSSYQRRAYIKGYINVNGVKVAIYSVHLGFHDFDVNINSYVELINMLKQEDYFVCMGDMNNENIVVSYMKAAGFNVANDMEFDTVLNGISCIDNIFTSSNIDIKYVESQGSDESITTNRRGYSDHYPLTAYLSVNTEKGSAAQPVTDFDVDEDGYVKAYY